MPISKRHRLFLRSFLISLFLIAGVLARAALVFVGAQEGSATTSGTHTVGLTTLTGGSSSTATTGDLVIVAHGFVSTADGNPGVTTTGYTEVADLYGNDTRDINFSVSWKLLGASPDTSVTCNGGAIANDGSACIAYVWRGADQGTPIDTVTQTATSGNSAVWNSPSITPVTAGAVVLSLGGSTAAANAGDTSITAPVGYSNQADRNGNGSVLSVQIGVASIAWSGSGAEDPAAWTNITTSNADSWAAATVAIRPAAAPSTCTSFMALLGVGCK